METWVSAFVASAPISVRLRSHFEVKTALRPDGRDASPTVGRIDMGEVGFILAATGEATRFGELKQLVRYRGRALIRCLAQEALDSVCDRILVVLAEPAESSRAELTGLPVRIVENAHSSIGTATSIRSGLAELERLANGGLDAVVISTCDQPLLSASVIDRLVSTFRSTGRRVVASRYAGTTGPPALFGRDMFGELRVIDPSEGVRSLLRKRTRDLAVIDFPGGEIDVDSVKDLDRLYAA